MKNILMSLVLLGTFAAMSAKGDSFLYWMVDADGANLFGADTAVLMATKSGGNDYFLGATALNGGDTVRLASDPLPDLGEGWSFYVELYNDNAWVGQSNLAKDINGNVIASDGIVSYTAAYKAGAIYRSLDPNGLAQVVYTSFTNVPEPTSGLLVLLGVCGLALKRKRI